MLTGKHELQTLDRAVPHTANTGFASGGVTCKLGALCFYSSVVLVDSFVLRNPPERKARKRYKQALLTTKLTDKINKEFKP
jgi:hypothetical protein